MTGSTAGMGSPRAGRRLPRTLLLDQQLGKDLKGLVFAPGNVGEPCERCLRVAFEGFDHELDAETDEGSGSGLERNGKGLYWLLATQRLPARATTAEAAQPDHHRAAPIARSVAAFDAGTTYRPGAKRSPFRLHSRVRFTTSVASSVTG